MLLEKIIAAIVPHTCIGCDAEETLLCDECSKAMTLLAGCRRCSYPESVVCASPTKSHLNHLFVCSKYEGYAKELIQRLKFEFTPAAAEYIAAMLSRCMLPQEAVIIPVRTSPLRYRQRGYDQTVLICRALARQTEMVLCNTLIRSGKVRQLGAGRNQRLIQQQGLYMVRSPKDVENKRILLVDDVRTTGATLESAAYTLLAAGAKSVDGLVFAQA